jgi:hypothetical protein
MLGRSGLYRLRENSCFLSAHDFCRALIQSRQLTSLRENSAVLGRSGLYRLRENSCFLSAHGFCRALIQSRQLTSLRENSAMLGRSGLHRLRKNSCFVSGHDFSRAAQATSMRALAPEALLSCAVQTLFPQTLKPGLPNSGVFRSCSGPTIPPEARQRGDTPATEMK